MYGVTEFIGVRQKGRERGTLSSKYGSACHNYIIHIHLSN